MPHLKRTLGGVVWALQPHPCDSFCMSPPPFTLEDCSEKHVKNELCVKVQRADRHRYRKWRGRVQHRTCVCYALVLECFKGCCCFVSSFLGTLGDLLPWNFSICFNLVVLYNTTWLPALETLALHTQQVAVLHFVVLRVKYLLTKDITSFFFVCFFLNHYNAVI